MAAAVPNLLRSNHAGAAMSAAAWVGCVVFAAALAGILTRPLGFLAAIWPANALLLGLLIRNPHFATPAGWLGAAAGFIAADLVTGGGIVLTLWLTAANLVGVAIGFFLFQQLSDEDRHLRRPLSVLYLFAWCGLAAAAAAVVGSGSAPLYFGKGLATGLAFWFTTELVNYVVLLPTLLTAPRLPALLSGWRRAGDTASAMLKRSGPALALVASIVAGLTIGGPGAIAFPVPALLWCALTYSLFATSLLTTLLCAWLLVAISAGLLPLPFSDDFWHSTVSVRLGITLLALGPLTTASINAARNDLLRRLDHAASHDALTGVLSRAAFMERGRAALAACAAERAPATVLMLDIDRFKAINDRHGHAAGDQVLTTFAGVAGRVLREGDVLGRLGGEEFAVVLPRTARDDALAVAERVRARVEAAEVAVAGAAPLRLSVSIGLAARDPDAGAELEGLLSVADAAMYRAKGGGRNRVVAAA